HAATTAADAGLTRTASSRSSVRMRSTPAASPRTLRNDASTGTSCRSFSAGRSVATSSYGGACGTSACSRAATPAGSEKSLLTLQCSDPPHVLLAPSAQRLQHRVERGAELGHRILHPRRDLVIGLPMHDTIRLQ